MCVCVCVCVNLQVIMSSPLLWLVAQTPKECLCMHVVYGMVGNVRVPIIWLVIGQGVFQLYGYGRLYYIL